jgi:hypothetical protein
VSARVRRRGGGALTVATDGFGLGRWAPYILLQPRVARSNELQTPANYSSDSRYRRWFLAGRGRLREEGNWRERGGGKARKGETARRGIHTRRS